VILMAHEPDTFTEVPNRVALTVSGHTHGGQVNLAGFTPVVPSKYGSRYVYGHINEGGAISSFRLVSESPVCRSDSGGHLKSS